MNSRTRKLQLPLLASILLAAFVVSFCFCRPAFDQTDLYSAITSPVWPSKPSNQDTAKPLTDTNQNEPAQVEPNPARELKQEDPPKQLRFCDKKNDSDTATCIFDVGLNTAQDTVQYLAAQPTTRVLGVEANPILINNASKRFPAEINATRLKLLNVGLVGRQPNKGEQRQKLTFWINIESDVYSSFKQTIGCRAPGGKVLAEGDTRFCRKIEMDTMSCSELVQFYGTPDYMKIDIEGLDRECVYSLRDVSLKDRPKYISKENLSQNDIDVFAELGYKKFKVVNQNTLQEGLGGSELHGQSGPWGEEAVDIWLGKKWQSYEEISSRMPLRNFIKVGGKVIRGWYDLHAAI